MYCEKCGRKYTSDENFCAECGSKLVDELEIYAKQFLNGDESAFEKIYNHTKINVFTYVFMYFKNQEDCLDCIREIYLKLFYKINLYEPQNGNFR